MDTDTPQNRSDFENPEPTADLNAGAYVDDTGLNEFSVNQTSTPGPSLAPMETDAPQTHGVSNMESNQQTTLVDMQTRANVDANPSPQSSPDDVPPPWVIRIGQEFLSAFHTQQEQDRVCFSLNDLSSNYSLIFTGRIEQHANWVERGYREDDGRHRTTRFSRKNYAGPIGLSAAKYTYSQAQAPTIPQCIRWRHRGIPCR
jgi:hypothetical protein